VRYTAPLAGVTAAIVGVIVNLAVFFGIHALAPRGALDPVSVTVALGAALALFRFRTGVIPVIVAGAVAGIVAAAVRGQL
jgi:chromate transporter